MSDADDIGAHHGAPIITERDFFMCRAMVTWIETARAAGGFYGPAWLPGPVDILKSRLFWRIRSGKKPLPEPPPTAYSCPWYELVDEPERLHWAAEMWTDGNKICSIAQCRYEVEKWTDDRKPAIIKFGSYRFEVWEGHSPRGFDGKPAPHGWWLQRLVGDVTDDPSKRGSQDRQRVIVHVDYELRYWSEKFGVSTDELLKAVQQVGPMANDVARHLGKAPAKS